MQSIRSIKCSEIKFDPKATDRKTLTCGPSSNYGVSKVIILLSKYRLI